MPGKVKVRILAGRNLPVMDKSSDTSDAFVEVKLGNTTYKTEVFRRSLNPFWNSEWFRFEVDDEELQDEPLQIRIMDYDTYSANDAIGKVYIDLNPLLSKDSGHVMSGWFPIYDTMHGIRGEMNCVVKVALFSDANRFRQSSCGVKFFYTPGVPYGYTCKSILGFVEELVVNHDPEYQWIDKIRTPRASNEARQTLFSKISGEVQRKIGLKAIDLGGNAVVGYQQYFDMEGESGIVVRGIGTTVFLTKNGQSQRSGTFSSNIMNYPDVCYNCVPIPIAFLSSCYTSLCNTYPWSSNSSTPSPPPFQKPNRSPSPSPRFPSSLLKLIKSPYSSQSHNIGVSLEAETPLRKEKVNKPLKRVASQPVNATRATGSLKVHHDYHAICSIQRSPNANADDSMMTSCSSPLIASISTTLPPPTAPIVIGHNIPLNAAKSGSPTKTFNYGPRRLSESDLSATPKANSAGGSHSSGAGSSGNHSACKFVISPESLHLLEYPFVTMKSFPSGLIQHIGGVVSARSVKLLDQINNPEVPETRDAWWNELRKEIRSHTRVLGCNSVLGYSESTHIFDDICILSASGTAAILRTGDSEQTLQNLTNQVGYVNIANQHVTQSDKMDTVNSDQNAKVIKSDNNTHVCDVNIHSHEKVSHNCSLCHIPYTESSMPFPTTLVKCWICKKAKVPDVLFMTIEPPPNIPITGHGTLIQARVCRTKRDSKGEVCAKEMSDSLPFLEYELHRQLLSKLKVKGMNSLFSISIQVSVGDNMLVAIATGTGAFISALPPPSPPKISSGKGVLCSKLNEIQTLISQSISRNREHYNISAPNNVNGETDDVNDIIVDGTTHGNRIDLTNGNKDSCVLLEVDDTEDADIISLMIDSDVPKGYEICNCETLPGMGHRLVCNLQMFSQVYRAKLTSIKQFGHQFDWIVQSLFVKFRRLTPCCLTDLKFRVDLPEPDLVQITAMGTAVGIGAPIKLHQKRKNTLSENGDNDLMFIMDEDITINEQIPNSTTGPPFHLPPVEHFGIELTPLSYVPGGCVDHYLGNLDFFFIRESSSIREYGGLNGFMHSFMTEVFAIVRAHVAALGGNAMIAFHLTQLLLFYNPHKNQAQCLMNVAGDAVNVHYINRDKNMNRTVGNDEN